MGVKELSDVIRRYAPQTIVPQTLASINSCTVALDGNLWAKKFHYSPAAEETPGGQLALWYYFVRTLKEYYHLKPICVFDGAARPKAKDAERLRRAATLDLTVSRMKAETARSHRLTELRLASQCLLRLPKSERQTVMGTVQQILLSIKDREAAHVAKELAGAVEDGGGPLPLEMASGSSSPASSSDDATHDRDGFSSRRYLERDPVTPEEEPGTLRGRNLFRLLGDLDAPRQDRRGTQEANQLLSSSLASVLSDFRQDKGTSIYSKRQQQLISEEASIYDALRSDKPLNLEQVSDLENTSLEMSQSYQRKAAPLTSTHLSQVMELVDAMGVPVLETSTEEPHEGEALCSALVHAGRADFVSSEDTDVLIYEAKLLRQLSMYPDSRNLHVCDGKDLREALGLNRAQFLDLAILLGTDYSTRPHKCGPVTAVRLIREHGSLEEIHRKEAFPRGVTPEAVSKLLREAIEARQVYQNLPNIPNSWSLSQRPEKDRLTNLLKIHGIASRVSQSLSEGGSHEGSLNLST